MKLLCKECGKGHYKIRDINLIRKNGKIDDDFYEQRNICMSCGVTTVHKISFISDGYKYRTIWSGGAAILLHRFVMELMLGRQLTATERVMFINRDWKDCRPSNLKLVKKKRQKRWRF